MVHIRVNIQRNQDSQKSYENTEKAQHDRATQHQWHVEFAWAVIADVVSLLPVIFVRRMVRNTVSLGESLLSTLPLQRRLIRIR